MGGMIRTKYRTVPLVQCHISEKFNIESVLKSLEYPVSGTFSPLHLSLILVTMLPLLVALTVLAGSVLGTTPSVNKVVTYPIPSGVATNPSFTISVKVPSGRWQDIDAYLTTLNMVNTTTGGSNLHNSSMAYFDFSGSVEVSVTYNKGHVKSARIRPDSYEISPEIRGGNNLLFTITKPQNLMISVNDDIFDCLHLFSNPIETDIPSSSDKDVIYFGPGLHTVPGNVLNVTSGKTVYIAGGGVLTAKVAFQNVSDVALRGRGVLYHSSSDAILVEYSSNVAVSDIISLNPSHYAVMAGEVDGMTIRGLRSFSGAGNGDGIDFFCSQNILIDGVFMRNSDDNIAIYSHVSDSTTSELVGTREYLLQSLLCLLTRYPANSRAALGLLRQYKQHYRPELKPLGRRCTPYCYRNPWQH
jgi:hypothetical protein